MGKTDPSSQAEPDAVEAVPGGAEAHVIRAVPGQPWPQPPRGGRWVRNAKTGDLTLMQAPAAAPTPEQRAKRRDEQRKAEEQHQAAQASKKAKE